MNSRLGYLKRKEVFNFLNEKEYASFLIRIVNNPAEYYERFLLCQIKEGQKILDYGCGPGKLLEFLKKKYPKAILYGCDVNKYLIRECKKNVNLRGIKFLHAEKGKKASFQNKYFDVVFLLDVLEHTENPEWVLGEINRILKRGGRLILNTPDRLSLVLDPSFYGNLINLIPFNFKRVIGKALMEYTHRREFSFRELKALLEKTGFKIIKANHKDFIYSLPLLHRGAITLLLEKIVDYES